MKNWTQLIPANIRNALYIGFGVLSLAQSAILAYSAAVQTTAPVWAIGGGAVLGVIGGAFGFVAAGNVDVSKTFDETVKQAAQDAKTAYPISGAHAATTADPERYNGDQ